MLPSLPPELSERIISCLVHNEVAGTLRLVSRAAAAQFRGPQHATIRLSQPVPPHAFTHKWAAPGATRGLSLRQRRELLRLTAASGIISNMEMALEAAGCLPGDETAAAAAGAGQLEMCKWLRERGLGFGGIAISAAAASGHRHVCEWLLGIGAKLSRNEHWAAVRGGHMDLFQWLELNLQPSRQVMKSGSNREMAMCLCDVATGCDLATLQRLHREWLGWPAGGEQPGASEHWPTRELLRSAKAGVLAAAAGSPTPDWQAKVEWLEGQGYPRTAVACESAAYCPNAVSRLQWLRQRGYPLTEGVSLVAARQGNLVAVQYLYGEGQRSPFTAVAAALHGLVQVVAWLVEAPGVAVPLGPELLNAAAQSGSLELLVWLRERGCAWDRETFAYALHGGNDIAIEWLVEQGCAMEVSDMWALDSPYEAPLALNDLTTLRCLSRLGCPWPRNSEGLFRNTLVVDRPGTPKLRCLLEAGCPVDWRRGEALIESSRREHKAAVLELLRRFRPPPA